MLQLDLMRQVLRQLSQAKRVLNLFTSGSELESFTVGQKAWGRAMLKVGVPGLGFRVEGLGWFVWFSCGWDARGLRMTPPNCKFRPSLFKVSWSYGVKILYQTAICEPFNS